MKKIWKTIGEVLNKTKKKEAFPDFFRDDNKPISDKLEIANRFNSFFTNIGKKCSR